MEKMASKKKERIFGKKCTSCDKEGKTRKIWWRFIEIVKKISTYFAFIFLKYACNYAEFVI